MNCIKFLETQEKHLNQAIDEYRNRGDLKTYIALHGGVMALQDAKVELKMAYRINEELRNSLEDLKEQLAAQANERHYTEKHGF